jgi:hypothetical protein
MIGAQIKDTFAAYIEKCVRATVATKIGIP